MQYILDFDDTLFDTKRFKEDVRMYEQTSDWAQPQIWETFDAKSYLFGDTVPFISEHADETIILTAYNPLLGPEAKAFQEAKVARSGIAKLVKEVVYVEGEKGEVLSGIYNGGNGVFVDDKLVQLRSVQAHCPKVRVVQMVRSGLEQELESDESIPVVDSLKALTDLIEKT